MEDAPEDDKDIKLQKISGDYIADFDRSLEPFLRKPDGQLRSRVRINETTRLASSLLDPFQELPQLLDPHLPRWLPVLAASYLEHLNTHARRRTKPSEVPSTSARARLLEPLPAAICKLLYRFAKIRGPSVVLRFLPVEARHLEPLLSALEAAEKRASRPSLLAVTDPSRAQAVAAEPSQRDWEWEERYVVLLWLSHLLLAPFDLSTISSADPDDAAVSPVSDLVLPKELPGITSRILPIGIKYLACPGKERDGARHLLVRICMRKDMQHLGVLDALVGWALTSLRQKREETAEQPYFYIGILSFLAGVLKSSVNTSDMKKHLTSIFDVTHALSTEQNPISESTRSYAVARKMMIKVIRSVAVQILRQEPQDMAGTEVVESSISYLLECLADNETPVRFAASKALSVITLKLDPDMAEQVVEAVLEALNRNVLFTRSSAKPDGQPTRDLDAVDPLEWHGLMLTLSNLLYRRSPPASQLPDVIHGLLLGISFEKRSTSGGSIGTNVRDAACFGIWALARRYTTQELLAVPAERVLAARIHPPESSILQVLATELVVAACLDSAGNIRRGSSAALQELIGRHPDTVDKGIWVVQAVDYHAVALRSRAMHEVALKTTDLSPQYGRALLHGLLGWRGIGDPDAAARRAAGLSFGTLTLAQCKSGGVRPAEQFEASVQMVLGSLDGLQTRQVDERHGLLLSLAAVLDRYPEMRQVNDDGSDFSRIAPRLLGKLADIVKDGKNTKYRRPELVSEATSRLIISSLPILQTIMLESGDSHSTQPLRPGMDFVCPSNLDSLSCLVAAVDALDHVPDAIRDLLAACGPVIDEGLGRSEKEAITAASQAALILLALSPIEERKRITRHWADTVRQRPTSRTTHSTGYFYALTMAHPIARLSDNAEDATADVAVEALLARWRADKDIDTRVAILKSLTQSVVLRDCPLGFLDILAEGLNDYTTTARGDVGSHVRLEALRATKIIWQTLDGDGSEQPEDVRSAISKLYLRVLRLAAEKLDRVRTEAHSVLASTLLPAYAAQYSRLTFSSRPYFHSLLSLPTRADALQPRIAAIAASDPEAWTSALLAGYVTSADTGNEDLVIASRAALTSFCAASLANLEGVCGALVRNLATYQEAAQDRVLVPTLEVVAFLFRVGLFQTCPAVNLRKLCLLVQKAGYKTGNVRKLEACVHVYGCVAAVREGDAVGSGDETLAGKRIEGIREAKKRLGALLSHPWPKVRNHVVDELWRLFCDGEQAAEASRRLKGVDWGRADKEAVKGLVSALALG